MQYEFFCSNRSCCVFGALVDPLTGPAMLFLHNRIHCYSGLCECVACPPPEITDGVMNKMAKAGLVSMALLNCVADNREKPRAFREKACSLTDSVTDLMEAAKILSCYVVAKISVVVEAKAQAEPAAAELPWQLKLREVSSTRRPWISTSTPCRRRIARRRLMTCARSTRPRLRSKPRRSRR